VDSATHDSFPVTDAAVVAASEVPLWATLLVGLAGGIIGTLATVSHERGAEFRTRMLTAADEYLQALTDAVNRVGDVRTLPNDAEAQLDDAFEQLEEALDEARVMLGRVNLLFGANSPTWATASTAFKAVSDQAETLHALRAGSAEARNIFNYNAGVLQSSVDSFGADARSDVRAVGMRFPRWLRGRFAGSPTVR
jgi:hypothetical protein